MKYRLERSVFVRNVCTQVRVFLTSGFRRLCVSDPEYLLDFTHDHVKCKLRGRCWIRETFFYRVPTWTIDPSTGTNRRGVMRGFDIPPLVNIRPSVYKFRIYD